LRDCRIGNIRNFTVSTSSDSKCSKKVSIIGRAEEQRGLPVSVLNDGGFSTKTSPHRAAKYVLIRCRKGIGGGRRLEGDWG
jgi:hypothetical protein